MHEVAELFAPVGRLSLLLYIMHPLVEALVPQTYFPECRFVLILVGTSAAALSLLAYARIVRRAAPELTRRLRKKIGYAEVETASDLTSPPVASAL